MSSQDTSGEIPPKKSKKKKIKSEINGVDESDGQRMEMGGLGSRRASEVAEQGTIETPADVPPPQRRRKKKKTATIDLEDDQADLVGGDIGDQGSDVEETSRKPKKKKKTKMTESQLPDELDVEEDDIITNAETSLPQHSLFSAPQGVSQPVGKVFVERNKKFQAAERSRWRKTSVQADSVSDFQPMPPPWTTKDVSVKVHQGFRMFGLYCNGFLAGYAVWNVVVVYMLAGQHLTALSNLLQQYNTLAYPSQSLLYMLLAVSTVAAFDRVNLAKGSLALREFITLDPVALASFLYFSALILSLSQQMTSDRINLYPKFNTTLWPPGSEERILHPWATVNLTVALLVGLAWICIAIKPERDYTENYLQSMDVEPQQHEEKPEVTA